VCVCVCVCVLVGGEEKSASLPRGVHGSEERGGLLQAP
jgi:hypothetical protein